MTGQAISLDHLGIIGRDLAPMAEEFSRIGFTLTPRALHSGGRTGNRCAMLDGGYIELMATVEGGASATLDRFLARYPGIHTLAFAADDAAAASARLRRGGIQAPEPAVSERAVDAADPDGPCARFALVTPPEKVTLPSGVSVSGAFSSVSTHSTNSRCVSSICEKPNA